MEKCPKCQSMRVHRSRTRSAFERFRRNFTGKAPFRCPACGWRGWGFDFGSRAAGSPAMGRQSDLPEPNLEELDRQLAGEPG